MQNYYFLHYLEEQLCHFRKYIQFSIQHIIILSCYFNFIWIIFIVTIIEERT